MALDLIIEAHKDGARLNEACEAMGLSVSTFRRWESGNLCDNRKGSEKSNPRKLSLTEQIAIIDACCSPEYKDCNMYEIHSSLLDKGIYLGSESTFYRIMRQNNLIRPRRNTKVSGKKNRPPERKATGPNQVWCWDITWLKSVVTGLFYYAYVIIDVWDRSIVKWTIHDREDETLASELFQRALRDNNYPDVFVHSDNGNPMKGVTLLGLFYDLGICNSYSRPRVSDDNPFIESWFKTMKYDVSYPGKFKNVEEARCWFSAFVNMYNTSHSHSGMNFITPAQIRNGEYQKIARNRNNVMLEAKARNPIRWVNEVKQLPEEHVVYLNPTVDTRLKLKPSVA
ncbi:MAG: IS3 family transposase [Clostridia bacterium]|nr:IS3 family transposase [Clostridia bacterium]